MSSPLENLAFRIAQHRSISTSPIYSINDPWLGIDTQLLPLPEGLFRILVVAIPTFLLPHLLNQMRLMPGQEVADDLLLQLALFRRLYLQQKRICGAVQHNSKRLDDTKAGQFRTLLKMRKRQAFFYFEDIEEMRDLWYQAYKTIAFPRGWKFLLFGRKHAAIEDGEQSQQSSAGQIVDDSVKSLSSTSTSALFRRVPRTQMMEEDQDDHFDTSSDVTASQPNSSMLEEEGEEGEEDTQDDYNTPLQSPTTPQPRSPISDTVAGIVYQRELSREASDPSSAGRLDVEAERTLDVMYPLAL